MTTIDDISSSSVTPTAVKDAPKPKRVNKKYASDKKPFDQLTSDPVTTAQLQKDFCLDYKLECLRYNSDSAEKQLLLSNIRAELRARMKKAYEGRILPNGSSYRHDPIFTKLYKNNRISRDYAKLEQIKEEDVQVNEEGIQTKKLPPSRKRNRGKVSEVKPFESLPEQLQKDFCLDYKLQKNDSQRRKRPMSAKTTKIGLFREVLSARMKAAYGEEMPLPNSSAYQGNPTFDALCAMYAYKVNAEGRAELVSNNRTRNATRPRRAYRIATEIKIQFDELPETLKLGFCHDYKLWDRINRETRKKNNPNKDVKIASLTKARNELKARMQAEYHQYDKDDMPEGIDYIENKAFKAFCLSYRMTRLQKILIPNAKANSLIREDRSESSSHTSSQSMDAPYNDRAVHSPTSPGLYTGGGALYDPLVLPWNIEHSDSGSHTSSRSMDVSDIERPVYSPTSPDSHAVPSQWTDLFLLPAHNHEHDDNTQPAKRGRWAEVRSLSPSYTEEALLRAHTITTGSFRR